MPFDTDGFDIADTTLGVLLRARRRVQGGWTQDELRGGESFCAVGGVSHDNRAGLRADALGYLYRALPWRYKIFSHRRWENLSRAGNCVAVWNDKPYRTQADVLSLYDHAIAMCKNARQG